jgi:hypothetical protein
MRAQHPSRKSFNQHLRLTRQSGHGEASFGAPSERPSRVDRGWRKRGETSQYKPGRGREGRKVHPLNAAVSTPALNPLQECPTPFGVGRVSFQTEQRERRDKQRRFWPYAGTQNEFSGPDCETDGVSDERKQIERTDIH